MKQEIETKKCSNPNCSQPIKPITEFHKNKNICKECKKFNDFNRNHPNKILNFWELKNIILPINKTENNLKICWICGEKFKNHKYVASHCSQIHKLNSEQYYIKFYRILNENKCIICSKLTPYFSHKVGYQKTCSNSCGQLLPNTKIKKEQTIMDKYGSKCITQSEHFKLKAQKTWISRYGVDNPSKSLEISKKQHKRSYLHKNYKLPSGKIVHIQGYEPQFLDYVFNNKILKENEIIYYPNGIKYIAIDNKERVYFPDFYIPKWNLIIEIKSTWTIFTDKNVYLKEKYTKKGGYNYIRLINNKTSNKLMFCKMKRFINNLN